MLRRTPENSELWSQSGELMERCVSEVRTLSYLLHPPMMDAVGLASAARWYVEGFGQRSGIKVTLEVPHELARMPDEVELALFRAIQEALTNVHRHGGQILGTAAKAAVFACYNPPSACLLPFRPR